MTTSTAHQPGSIVRIQDPADPAATTTAMVIARGEATSRIQYDRTAAASRIRTAALDALPSAR